MHALLTLLLASLLLPASAALPEGALLAPPRVLVAAPATGADPAAIERLVRMGVDDNRVMEELDALVNGIGPRLTGSTNLERAQDWAVERFRSFGLEARLEPWGEAAVRFDRGPSHGAAFFPAQSAENAGTASAPVAGAAVEGAPAAGAPAADAAAQGSPGTGSTRDELTFLTPAWTPGTGGPRRARAVVAPSDVESLAARREELRGAWLLLKPEDAQKRELRTELEKLAGELALAGLVQRGPENDLLVMGGREPKSLDDMAKLPRVVLLRSQFDPLLARILAGDSVELEFDIDNRASAGPVVLNNVVAELRGSELPDECVIVGGHIDSWDGATGTTDNGTGCATTLEAARLLAASGVHPRRTIRFMLWSGEEQGLLGSTAWVKAHPEALPKISAVLVHDGGTNYVSGIGATPAMHAQMESALAEVQKYVASAAAGTAPGTAAASAAPAAAPFTFTLREVPGLDAGGASDHAAFIAAGVPGFFWDQAGEANYDHTHHTQFDTYDAARRDYEAHSSIVIALAALGIADLPALLDRKHLTVPRRTLGVFIGEDGLVIGSVVPGSQAERAGMKAGDRLASVNGASVPPGGVGALLAAGEPRKLVAWKRGEEVHSAVFAWDVGDIDRAPERVELVAADGTTIKGDYFAGATGGPCAGAALVLLHMNRSDRGTWAPVREPLYRAGIATLAIDLRGHGESVDADGALASRVAAGDPALYNAMEQDAAAAAAWLEARGYTASRIGLMGASVGCSVALRAATTDGGLAGVAALTPGTDYLGVDSAADIARWDRRPLLLVSSHEEADVGAQPLHDALLARDPWAPVQLVLLDGTGIHGTRMFGKVPGIEQQLADWWARVLR